MLQLSRLLGIWNPAFGISWLVYAQTNFEKLISYVPLFIKKSNIINLDHEKNSIVE